MWSESIPEHLQHCQMRQLWFDRWKRMLMADVKVASHLIPNRAVAALQIAPGELFLGENVSLTDFEVHKLHYFDNLGNLNATAESLRVSTSLAFSAAYCSIKKHEEQADTP